MTGIPHLRGRGRRRALLAAAAILAGGAATAYALQTHAGGADGPDEQPPFVHAERRRAEAAATEFARSCRPPCRVHSVEPFAPGVWRVRLNFANGYCVLVRLDEFRRTRRGTHEGWEMASCAG